MRPPIFVADTKFRYYFVASLSKYLTFIYLLTYLFLCVTRKRNKLIYSKSNVEQRMLYQKRSFKKVKSILNIKR